MKLAPLLLLFCTLCSATKKIKDIKRLIITVGGLAALANRGGGGGIGKSLQLGGGGIGKTLQLLSHLPLVLNATRSAAAGQQYASGYVTQPLVITTVISPHPSTAKTQQPLTATSSTTVNTLQPSPLATNTLQPLTSANTLQPLTSSINTLQPLTSTLNTLQPLTPTFHTLQPLTPTLNTFQPLTPTLNTLQPLALNQPSFALPVPDVSLAVGNPLGIPINQHFSVATAGLVQPAPILHQVGLAQSPVFSDPLIQSGWAG